MSSRDSFPEADNLVFLSPAQKREYAVGLSWYTRVLAFKLHHNFTWDQVQQSWAANFGPHDGVFRRGSSISARVTRERHFLVGAVARNDEEAATVLLSFRNAAVAGPAGRND